MKKSLSALLIAAPLAIALSGCVVKVGGGEDGHYSSSFEDREYENRKNIAKLPLGSSVADAQHKLGVADFNEVYTEGDEKIRVLYYRTHRKNKDGLTTKDECTYLHFINGEMISTGNGEDYSRHFKS